MPETGSPVEIFAALADDSRWLVLETLGTRPASASALAADLPISRQAIAKHLRILHEVGLVEAHREGREVRYTAMGARLGEVARRLDAIAGGWERRLRHIKDVAETPINPA